MWIGWSRGSALKASNWARVGSIEPVMRSCSLIDGAAAYRGAPADSPVVSNHTREHRTRSRDVTSSDTVKVERQGGVVLVTLNRPAARNAINVELCTAFCEALAASQDA